MEHSFKDFLFQRKFPAPCSLLAVLINFFIVSFISVKMDILKIRLMLPLVCPVLFHILLTDKYWKGRICRTLCSSHMYADFPFLPIALLECV